jgi:cell division protein FtsQ
MPEQGGDILARFGEDHFLERYQRYKAHIAEWRQQYPRLAEVDLRYDQQVVLQMAPAAAQNAVNDGDDKPVATDTEKTPDKKQTVKPDPPKQTAGGNQARTHAGAKAKAVVKAKAAKSKDAKSNEKKRAEASRAALNLSRQKTAPRTLPATVARQGQ